MQHGIIFGNYIEKPNMKRVLLLTAMLIPLFFLTKCKEEPETGQLTLHFNHLVNLQPLVTDTMKYTNLAGNEYLITEVQYFISNLKIHYQDGEVAEIEQDGGIHYIDSDIPKSWVWEIRQNIPAGVIDSISFTFGLDEATNITGLFPDAPESNMIWPDQLGGGYHYMKLNGKWLNTNNEISMFNFHLGIGQLYDNNGQVTEFVQNYFRANCYLALYSSFIAMIEADQVNHLSINMNIASWFESPNTWDFNLMGGMMMQNQEAQQAAKENGFDVFSIGPYVP
jgi:hypothetical protein